MSNGALLAKPNVKDPPAKACRGSNVATYILYTLMQHINTIQKTFYQQNKKKYMEYHHERTIRKMNN